MAWKFGLLGGLIALAGAMTTTETAAQSEIVNVHNDYRIHTVRRYNDIQGIEAIYDDYRRGRLRRHKANVSVGDQHYEADTPRCSRFDDAFKVNTSKASCGRRHVLHSGLTGLVANDTFAGQTDEVGVLGYLGYEYLFANDAFIGIGYSGGSSKIDQSLNGATLEVTTADNIGHLVGGYILPFDILNVWNISVGSGSGDTTRNSNITGDYTFSTMMLTGVFEKNYALGPMWDLSVGLDYTFNRIWTGGKYVDSAGVTQNAPDAWYGDFTGSLMVTRTAGRSELYARLGSTIELVNPTDRPLDVTLDVGGATKLNDRIAFVGSAGVLYRQDGYQEGRASLRMLGKF